MQVCETIHVPEVEPEHVAGMFRDFSKEELLRNDRGETPVETKCPICQRGFVSEKELVAHCSECDEEQLRLKQIKYSALVFAIIVARRGVGRQ